VLIRELRESDVGDYLALRTEALLHAKRYTGTSVTEHHMSLDLRERPA
jgi:hypothetical protein